MSGRARNYESSNSGRAGDVAANSASRTNTEGRDIEFQRRNFSNEESNFFLYRTVFLYVCFGIHGIETFLQIDIQTLLGPSGQISDNQVKRMCWVVCNFEQYLNRATMNGEFISLITTNCPAPADIDLGTLGDIRQISKSLATLVVRVFVAFQMRVNFGDVEESGSSSGSASTPLLTPSTAPSSAPSSAPSIAPYTAPDMIIEVITETNSDLESINPHDPEIHTQIDQEVSEKTKEAKQSVGIIIPPEQQSSVAQEEQETRRSNRVILLNQAIAEKSAARAAAAAEAAAEAQRIKQEKLEREKQRLQDCIAQFGDTIKFINPIPNGIFSGAFPVLKFELKKFYTLLPKLLARLSSCIEKRISLTEVKAGPGTVDTLNALGLPDPTMKIIDDEDESDGQGGGSSGKIRNRIFGITKRKKKNKILRKLKNKKVGRNLFHGGAGRKVSVRTYVEHTQAIPQCESTINNYHNYVSPSCYICGEPWIKGVQKSMECEHILCVIHGVEYYGLLQSVYLSEDQKNYLSILYAWAHRCCNQRKKNIAFIRKNSKPVNEVIARGNYFIPDEMNIRGLLTDIHTLSAYPESINKFDCNKIFKKGKTVNRKQFVDKRTAVVTSYVTPLVDCINKLFTAQFSANMVLFNAIGCLKIIAEMCIYLTAQTKKDPLLRLDIGKTANFMSNVVFPDCLEPPPSVAAAGPAVKASSKGKGKKGGAPSHNEKTRKLSRRKNKIQRGGASPELMSHFSGLFGQEQYETEVNSVKDIMNSPQFDMTNTQGLESLIPLQIIPLQIIDHDNNIDAILFILFVLNHYRNPSILLDLFLELKKDDDEIIREQQTEGAGDSDSIRNSLRRNKELRSRQKTAFINVVTNVFSREDIKNPTLSFFNAYDYLKPSLLGVLGFCARQSDFNHIQSTFIKIYEDIKAGVVRLSQHPFIQQFDKKVRALEHVTQGSEEVEENKSPSSALDHVMNAYVYLKDLPISEDAALGHPDTPYDMLEKAFELFPSCYYVDDGDLSSKFGACNAYKSVLGNEMLELTLGSLALADKMCVTFGEGTQSLVNSGQYTPEEARYALHLFGGFFDDYDQQILQECVKKIGEAAQHQQAAAAQHQQAAATTTEPMKPDNFLLFFTQLTDFYRHMKSIDPSTQRYNLTLERLFLLQQHNELARLNIKEQKSILRTIIEIILRDYIYTNSDSSQKSGYETAGSAGSQTPERGMDPETINDIIRYIMLHYNDRGERLNIEALDDFIISSYQNPTTTRNTVPKDNKRPNIGSYPPARQLHPAAAAAADSDGDMGGGGTSSRHKKRHQHRNTRRRIKQKINSKSRKTKKNRKL